MNELVDELDGRARDRYANDVAALLFHLFATNLRYRAETMNGATVGLAEAAELAEAVANNLEAIP